MVEQRFCKPLVGSSNLSPGTNEINNLDTSFGNRGKFPGAVLGLGRCRADKFGERRNDLGAGDAKASP